MIQVLDQHGDDVKITVVKPLMKTRMVRSTERSLRLAFLGTEITEHDVSL